MAIARSAVQRGLLVCLEEVKVRFVLLVMMNSKATAVAEAGPELYQQHTDDISTTILCRQVQRGFLGAIGDGGISTVLWIPDKSNALKTE
jgi:hypothetical protein